MTSHNQRVAMRIALLYLAFAGAWILLSDRAVESLVASGLFGIEQGVAVISRLQTYKGWGFVVTTSAGLFLLLRTELRRQRHLRTRLAESERARKALIENLPGMVYRCRNDRQWTMQYVSEGSVPLTGYTPEELVDNAAIAYNDLIHPEDRQMVWETVQNSVKRGERFQVTYRIVEAGGEVKWVWEQGTAAPPAQGTPVENLEGFITDVTDSVQHELDLERQLANVQALRSIDLAITSSLDQRLTFEVLLKQLTSRLGVHAADILRYDHNAQTLSFAMGRGFRTEALRHTHLRPGQGFAGRAALEREMVIIEDAREMSQGFEASPLFEQEGFIFYCAAPLIAKAQLRGVLEVFHRAPLHPEQDWVDFLELLAGQAAIAIDNATLFQELQKSNLELVEAYDQTLEGWAMTLEMRDQGTEGHTRRVTELSLQLARRLDVPNAELTDMRRGALLHDIGKMAIPDSILLKPSSLDSDEWRLMKRHPEFARQMLSKITYLQPALAIPYCHHERWDGSGYPQGLHGEEIPLAARIFSVADVWDALRSDRPYRQAWAEEEARRYIREQKGQHFDPAVVDAFFELVGGD